MINVIPAIDIINGACVRLKQGDYAQKQIYSTDPVAVATMFRDCGAKQLHLVDLDGAKAGRIANSEILSKISAIVGLRVDFGGGVQSQNDISQAFACGASQVNCGTVAVKQREQFLNWLKLYGPESLILSADVRNEQIYVSGWQEQTELNIFEFLDDYVGAGLKWLCCTDITRDGMNSGPAFELYKKLVVRYPSLSVISSGGVSSIEDVSRLEDVGLQGCIIGRALYDGLLNAMELFKKFPGQELNKPLEAVC
jgi:phosphoribosylformimino-5-aminoimidazole carboxamide ribotide isomerase